MKKYSDCVYALTDFLHAANSALSLPELNEARQAALLYLTLREGYALFGKPLFEARFTVDSEGLYFEPAAKGAACGVELSLKARLTAASVLEQYVKMDAQSFRELFEKDSCLKTVPGEKPYLVEEEVIGREARKLSILHSLWSMNSQAIHFEAPEKTSAAYAV